MATTISELKMGVYNAYLKCGKTQQQIADELGSYQSNISRDMKRLRNNQDILGGHLEMLAMYFGLIEVE